MQDTQLAERIKELNCLYGISRLFSQQSLHLEQLLHKVVQLVLPAWQFPEIACARILLRGREMRTKNFAESTCRLRHDLKVRKKRVGYLEIAYRKRAGVSARPYFLEEEKRLLKAITELLENIIEKKEAESALRETARQLKEQKTELERKNIALREIISQIEIEKREIQDRMLANIQRLILPTIAKLKSAGLPDENRVRYLRIVEQDLQQIASPFAKKISSERIRLSPREVEICNLIKNGFSNKEIAESLHISVLTVERHRHNIRRKLQIAKVKVNLATFLHEL